MSILGIILGVAVVVAVYLWVRRMDRNYYARRQEIIDERLARVEKRAKESHDEEES